VGVIQPIANRAVERFCLTRASRVVVVSEPMRTALIARIPAIGEGVVVIGNGFDRDDLPDTDGRPVSEQDRPIRFLYAGRLLRYQSVGTFFEVFGNLARRADLPPHLELLGFFHDEQLELARAAIDEISLTVRPGVSHRAAVEEMANADVLVTVTEGGGAGSGTMSGKLYEYLALRRPILLLGPEGPAADLLRTEAAGVAADPHDRVAVEAAIRDLSRMARDPGFRGASNETLASFERHNLAMRWSAMLDDVIGEAAQS
jgi:glycosyltransferase involved in cell wall biosynthesis